VRRALGEVRYRVDGATRWHENLTRAAVGAVKRDTRGSDVRSTASAGRDRRERCAVSVGPADRMFATPPDSPASVSRDYRMTDREKFRTRGSYYLFTRKTDLAAQEYTALVKAFPADASGYGHVPMEPLPFPTYGPAEGDPAESMPQ